MSKNRIKNLRTITVGDVEYKWMYDGNLKVWKDKKVIYEEGYNKGYKNVSYNLEKGIYGAMTPAVVAKVIRLVTYKEDLVSNEELQQRIEDESNFAIGYYGRHESFEDKQTERLWAELNDKAKELEEHLETQALYKRVKEMTKDEHQS